MSSIDPSALPPHRSAGTALTLTGQLPAIGMVAAPASSGGHVGIGIGIPIMSAASIGGTIGIQHQANPAHHGLGLISPDSSEDGILIPHQQLIQQSQQPILPNVANPRPCNNWPGPHSSPITSNSGIGFPFLGLTSNASLLGEPNLYYGINLLNSHQSQASPVPQVTPNHFLPSRFDFSTLLQLPTPTTISPVPISVISPNQQHSHNIPEPPNPSVGPTKEIIHCKSCTLFPPNPAAPLPTTRDKPFGCRTVFVGGLPENMTDDMVREVFERCGEITTVRMSKKNFCHIRFELEEFVDNAVYLSGYRIRIGSNSDNSNIGRFHVDFAQARDDLYEWECRQRQLQREQRHRDRLEQERLLPPSPPPVVHYSEHEAGILTENIKVDEHFLKSVQTLITWLERGDCSKRNAANFYSMIQSTHSHSKRFLQEKSQYENDLRKAKILANQRMQGLSLQLVQVEKVFMAASHKKVWDHFTKAQRKNIDAWKKQATDLQFAHRDECMTGVGTEDDTDMDMSDTDENHPEKKMRLGVDYNHIQNRSYHSLKEENDSLRCQLEAIKNEIDLIKADLQTELEAKEAQLRILQEQLGRNFRPGSAHCASPTQSDDTIIGRPAETASSQSKCDSTITQNRSAFDTLLLEMEARLIGLISTFLHVHPFGASLEYIGSFVQKVLPNLSITQIQTVLLKFPTIFKQQLSGVGVSLERKWTFVGFSVSNDMYN